MYFDFFTRKRFIRKKANKLTSIYDYVPIDVFQIAENLDYKTYVCDFKDKNKSFSSFTDFENKSIILNEEEDRIRQRYCCAFEIGNIVLREDFYKNNPDEYKFNVYRGVQVEGRPDEFDLEAQYFAVNLLIPDNFLFLRDLYYIDFLAKRFLVTKTMMEKRLQNLYQLKGK